MSCYSLLECGLDHKRDQEQKWEETECRYKDEAGGGVEKQFLFEGAFRLSHLIISNVESLSGM